MQKVVDFFCQSSDRTNKKYFLGLIKPLGGKLLDLGCSDGSFTVEIAVRSKAAEIFGAEIDKEAIAKARSKGIKAKSVDLNHKLPFQNNFFETVTANQVIEHLYFTDDFVDEIKRILKPGGQLIISTTNLAAYHYRLMLLLGQMPICLHPAQKQYGNFLKNMSNPRYGHKSVFTHKAFLEFIADRGFLIEEEKTIQLYPFGEKISRFALKFFPNFGVFSTIRAIKKT